MANSRRTASATIPVLLAVFFILSGCGSDHGDKQSDDADAISQDDDTGENADDEVSDDDTWDDDSADDDAVDDDSDDDTEPLPPILDDTGREIVLHGANYMAVESGATEDDYERMAAWGFNVVRILVTWQALEPTRGEYDPDYLPDVVEPQVEYATRSGLNVILDMHHYHWSTCCGGMGMPDWLCVEMSDPPVEWLLQSGVFWDDPRNLDDFVAAWQEVASYFAGDDRVFAYDLFNEPIAGLRTLPWTFENTLLRPLYERLIAAVRALHPEPYLLIEPSMINVLGLPCVMEPPAGERLIYSPHLYPGTIAEGGGYTFPRELLEWHVAQRRREAVRLGLPLLIGETGLKSGGVRAEDYARDACGLMDSAGAHWTWWAFGYDDGSMGLCDAAKFPKPEFYPHLSRPYPRATAGSLRFWSVNEDAGTFTMRFENKGDLDPSTEIFVRTSLHDSTAFHVASSDAAGRWSYHYDESTSVLSVDCDPDAEDHVITVVW